MGRCENAGHLKDIDFCHTLFIGWITLYKLTSVLYIILSWVGLAWHSRDVQKTSVQWPNSVLTCRLEQNSLDRLGIYSAFPVKYWPRSKWFLPSRVLATFMVSLAASLISSLRTKVTGQSPCYIQMHILQMQRSQRRFQKVPVWPHCPECLSTKAHSNRQPSTFHPQTMLYSGGNLEEEKWAV